MRLKGGDPFVFGRGRRGGRGAAAAGIPFEVVPGITSAIGAAAYAGIPVTHRGLSTHFTVVTGHEDPTKDRTDVDWAALARAGGTLVILMGAGRIGRSPSALIDGGRAPETPVAAVRNGTRPDQTTVRATLATVADAGVRHRARSSSATSPASTCRGSSADRCSAAPSSSPGRASRRAGCAPRLEELGAEVLELPAIEISPSTSPCPTSTPTSGWCSRRPTACAPSSTTGSPPRGSTPARSPACGSPPSVRAPRTRSRPGGLRTDLIPERFVAESLFEAFPPPSAPAHACCSPGPRSRATSPRRARRARLRGRRAPRVPHQSADARSRDGRARRSRAVDAVTFTSSSTVDNFCAADRPAPRPVPAGRVHRARHLGHRGRTRPARRRRGRPAHHRRPRRHPPVRFRRTARVTRRSAKTSSGSLAA